MTAADQEMARRLAYQTAAIDFAAKVDEMARAAMRLHNSTTADAPDDPLVLALAARARDVLAGLCAASPGMRAVFADAVSLSQPKSAPVAPENV